jgi:hypothetical protein
LPNSVRQIIARWAAHHSYRELAVSSRFLKFAVAGAFAASVSLSSVPSFGQQLQAFIAADVLISRCAEGPANDPSFCTAYLMGVADTLGDVYLRNCRPLVLETLVTEFLSYVAAAGLTLEAAEEVPAVNVVREMIRARFCQR